MVGWMGGWVGGMMGGCVEMRNQAKRRQEKQTQNAKPSIRAAALVLLLLRLPMPSYARLILRSAIL